MKKREPIEHIMTPNPIVLHLNDGLSQAEILFKTHKVRHLPVVSGNKIIGILSMTDLARISFVDSMILKTLVLTHPFIHSSCWNKSWFTIPNVSLQTPVLRKQQNFFRGRISCSSCNRK